MAVLTVENIKKDYGKIKALKGVSFNVPAGTVFGILGPNGSGKTTLLGIVTSVLKATSGNYKLWDEQPNDTHRKKIGTLLETPNFYHYLSAVQNLKISAAIKGVSEVDIDRVIDIVDLTHRKDSAFSTYSLGMKQRLAIGAALLGNPDVLVFDEPTNGLDPVGIAEIRNLIKALAAQGKTIIMASHLLDEVEKVCTHVAILKQGNLLASGNVDELFATDYIVQISAADLASLEQHIQKIPGYTKHIVDGQNVDLYYNPAFTNVSAINKFFFDNGVTLSHLHIKKQSLENKFIALTN